MISVLQWMFYRGFSLIFVVTLTFFALRLMPGDAIEAQLIQSGVSENVVNQRRQTLGLDKPPVEQFTDYLQGFITGNWGISLYSGQGVLEIILINAESTLAVALPALIFACIWGILTGVYAAFGGYGNFVGRIVQVIILLAIGMPIYWSATLAVMLFSLTLFWLPSSGSGTFQHVILPVAVLGFHTGGAIARITQIHIENAKQEDFVKTARAKGLTEVYINLHHVLRVGLIPILSVISLQAGFLISGTIITETVFVRPGLGRVLLDATLKRDFPVVQGIVIVSALTYILFNSLADLLYPLIDPRIRNMS